MRMREVVHRDVRKLFFFCLGPVFLFFTARLVTALQNLYSSVRAFIGDTNMRFDFLFNRSCKLIFDGESLPTNVHVNEFDVPALFLWSSTPCVYL